MAIYLGGLPADLLGRSDELRLSLRLLMLDHTQCRTILVDQGGFLQTVPQVLTQGRLSRLLKVVKYQHTDCSASLLVTWKVAALVDLGGDEVGSQLWHPPWAERSVLTSITSSYSIIPYVFASRQMGNDRTLPENS
jgi:hypothetical protein